MAEKIKRVGFNDGHGLLLLVHLLSHIANCAHYTRFEGRGYLFVAAEWPLHIILAIVCEKE
ncbi:hypothetical protein ARMA_1141 [Ardenticatena maritima]|uniref:Uncharacterized protein n=1 Tax=Ardenticatena maritima TaxID=872965 RepID=A0A0M9UC97_9CHLR|nr:hypothetical protein ARMA_1141 [Ardenticatena maritima]